MDKHIRENTDDYERIEKPDPNIDFRRVVNVNVFLAKSTYFKNLTTDVIPYLVHNAFISPKEEDRLLSRYEIIGHYRLVPQTK